MEPLDLQNPLTRTYDDLQNDSVPSLFANESDHMPSLLSSDLLLSIRRTALSLIFHAKFSYNLDPFLVYLSVSYVDRFLSKQKIQDKRPWIAHILVVASLSLAAKMRNSDLSISLSDLQRSEGFEFDSQSVHRMETILLATLEWRMRSITPFSFLKYFFSLLKIEDFDLTQSLSDRASDIIFRVQNELKILEYKPSIVAASALLCAIQDSTPLMLSTSTAVISSCEYIDKDTLLECVATMQERTRVEYESSLYTTASGTATPTSVLDRQLTSSISDETTSSTGFPERDSVKRRRLNGFCASPNFQMSQIRQC